MRVLATVVALLAVTATLAAPASASTPRTALVITYWPDGRVPAERVVWTLRCGPAGGSHPFRARACARLAQGGRALFRPTPPDMACTEIFGGHQTALVRGVVDGARVWARFSRVNGCAIDRWQRLVPVLPVASGPV